MEDWKYTSEAVSKANWIAQMEKDLKGKTLDSLQSEWWPGETLIPFQHREDLTGGPVNLPDQFFQQPPMIMEWIETSLLNTTDIQQKTKAALNYGTQSIVFDIGKNDQPEFGLWYEDVHPDMIETHLIVTPDFNVNASWVIEQLPFNTYLRLKRGNESSARFLKPAMANQKRSNIPFRFAYEIPAGGIWTDEVVAIFQKIFDDLVEWNSIGREKNDFLEVCLIEINPDELYVKQIIQTRVLQMVWLNFCSSISDQLEHVASPVECHIYPIDQMDPDRYLVRASSSALAATLTGVHALCIHHSDIDVPEYYERINRNIHHLLNLESEMYKDVDPLAGAYTVDYYTRKWSEDIWGRLNKIRSK